MTVLSTVISVIGALPVIAAVWYWLQRFQRGRHVLQFTSAGPIDLVLTTSVVNAAIHGVPASRPLTGYGQVRAVASCAGVLASLYPRKDVLIHLSGFIRNRLDRDVVILGGPAKNEAARAMLEDLAVQHDVGGFLFDDIGDKLKIELRRREPFSIDSFAPLDTGGPAGHPGTAGWTSSQVGGGAAVWGGIACRPTREELAEWPVEELAFDGFLSAAERLLGVERAAAPGRCPACGRAGRALQARARCLEPAPLADAARVRWGLGPARPVRALWPWHQVAVAERLNVDLRVGTRVTCLEPDGVRKSVRALRYVRRRDGRGTREAFELFVISCGAIQTVRLLLLSGMASLGTESDRLVGRYMCFHLFGPRLLVDLDHHCHQPPLIKRFRLPVTSATYGEGTGESRGGCFSVHSAFLPGADWSMVPGGQRRRCLDFRATGEDRPVFTNGVHLHARIRDAHGLPTAVVRRIAAEEDRVLHAMAGRALHRLVADLGLPVTRTSTFQDDWSRIGDHQLGGCRMSESSSHGVTRPDGRMHAMGNVFIVDASTFPTALAVPPTLSAVANALRITNGL
jgi:choline dehydrogenase-like flavoprotein